MSEILKILERSRSSIQPGLDRMKNAMSELGMSASTLPPSILIGGTNGKGSTSGILWRLLSLTGRRCGLYTSPHVLSFHERIQVSDLHQSMDSLSSDLELLKTKLSAETYESLSFFELTTLLAFFVFQRSKCELMVLEVGLGGRWDATNVVEPLASVIVSIDYDHQEWLGDSLEKIAGEKLGIARRGKPLFWGERVHCEVLEETLQAAQRDYGFILHRAEEKFPYDFPSWLNGRADVLKTNFALAYSVFEFLLGPSTTLGVTGVSTAYDEALLALSQFSSSLSPWPFSFLGRMQRLQIQGKNRTWDIYLDVCHNLASVRELISTLTQIPGRSAFGLTGDDDKNLLPLTGFVSILRDKDLGPMFSMLSEVLNPIHCFKIKHERSMTREHLLAHSFPLYENFEELWKKCADDISSPILVCGSFYTVSAVLEFFKVKVSAEQSFFTAQDPR